MGQSSKDDSATAGDDSSAGDLPDSNSGLFSEGEKVLAYHGPRIYEAKAYRLMKHTEENVLKQQALDKKQGMDKNAKPGRSAQTRPKSSTDAKMDKEDLKNNVAKGKKRKGDSGVETDNIAGEKLVKIQIPSTLKKQLVDDWESITQQDKVLIFGIILSSRNFFHLVLLENDFVDISCYVETTVT
ncbi:unnamed protein product [Ilex paraguariensis]|uniref:MRG domain-containing protein n=1 Tax=Ilex paraguariensis TaxID=185542 RepID=A0ABC8TCG5_9AQUA